MSFFAFYSALFLMGGCFYPVLELVWRGRTHISMAICGGLCLCSMCAVARLTAGAPFIVRSVLCAAVVTALELATGALVNLRLKLNVWDYSKRPLNFRGQICAEYSLAWLLIGAAVVAANDLA